MENKKRLIDANALTEGLKSLTGLFTDEIGFTVGLEPVLWKVDAQPTVDAVEVVHGRWLYDSGTERHFCSACGEYAISVISNEPVFEYDWEESLQFSHIETACDEQLTNFCPNCGAKMDGDGNG